MAERSIWKGYLKLSLVSCAVGLYPSTNSSARVRFNTLNRETGNRVQRQFVDSETHEVVEKEDQVKGFAIGKGRYIRVEEEELDALKLESTHTIDIETFVPREEVDERFLDTPYYMAPEDKVAQEAFAVIRDAIRDKGMAGIARVVLFRRERLLLIEPLEEGLVCTTLHAANEIKDEDKIFDEITDVKYPVEMRKLASHIINTKSSHFDPNMFDDRYEKAVEELVRSKQEGRPVKEEAVEEKPSNVISLMDALKRSVSTDDEPDDTKSADKKPSKPAAAKSTRKAPAKKSAAKKSATKKTRSRKAS
jgi:DNA end-binding protein Ku